MSQIEITTLGKSCEFYNGKAHEKSIDENGKYIVVNSKFISQEGRVIKRTKEQMFPLNKGEIVMVMSDVPNGKALAKCFIIDKDDTYSLNQRICCIRSKEFDTRYLYYQLNRHEHFLAFNNGENQTNLRKDDILACPLIKPSMEEQRRMVAELDEAFKLIEIAKSNVSKNLINASHIFASELDLIIANKGENWIEKTIKDLTTLLGDGLHGTPKYTENGEYYFINGNNLNNGVILFKEITKRVSIVEYNKYKKNLNDRTVFVSINGTLGNVAFYNGEKVILGKSACYFNLKESINKYFIKYILSSPYFINYAHKEATGATIKNVSLKTMREFIVPFPPDMKEQEEIVLKLDMLSNETKKLQNIYENKLEKLEELKSGILKRAFENELKEVEL